MSIKDNKELVIRYNKEIMASASDVNKVEAMVDKYCDPKFIYHMTTGDMDLNRTKQIGKEIRGSLDTKTTIEDIIAEGDKVVIRYTMTGTHKGTFRGIPATGKKFTQTGISIYRIKDGKFLECWVINDALGMMQQIGAIPTASLKK
jgi:ketosteroid isomerase-like protein